MPVSFEKAFKPRQQFTEDAFRDKKKKDCK